MGDKKMVLPPGFEFDPSDEELIVSFLSQRAANLPLYPHIIPDLDFYAANPWDLNDKALWSKQKWYFFSEVKKDRCSRKGFWKEVGVNEPIFTSNGDQDHDHDHQVGIKSYLVYYTANDDGSNVQTNWLMEEYHLLNYNDDYISTSQNVQQNGMQDMKEWVVCRVHEANYYLDDVDAQEKSDDEGVELSYLDEVFFSMEDDDQEEIISFPT